MIVAFSALARRIGSSWKVLATLLVAGLITAPAQGQIDAALEAAMTGGGRVPVIVIFDDSQRPASSQDFSGETADRDLRQAWQRRVLERAIGIGSANLSAPNATGSRLRREYQTIPAVSMFLSPAEINLLSNDPAISAIQLDALSAPQTDGTIPLIGANTLHSSGLTGAGAAVAILDTGVDHEHPMFTGRIVESLCYSTTVADQSTTLCAGGVETDITSADAGDDCAYTGDTETAITGCGHGTHVAGIAAGASWVDPGTGNTLIGVAPAANIIAIQVFSRFTNLCGDFGYSSPCALSYSSDQIAALDWILANHATYNVASANMSLGGGNYSSFCNADSRYTVINNLRTAGVATVIASGNSGYNSAVGAPGCVEPAITVGATDNSDNVASFSNSATMIDLLAPGVAINSAEPTIDDTLPGRARSISGTSMATPHVAGAFALLRAAIPGATVADIETALETTGVSVEESPSGLVRPRIQVDAAYNSFDTTPPTVLYVGRQLPSGELAFGSSVTWRVAFSEAVTGVDASDFTASNTTAGLAVTPVSSQVFDVTASGGNFDTVGAIVALTFAGGANITDTAGNAVVNFVPSAFNVNTFDVDNAQPVPTLTVPGSVGGLSPFNVTVSFNENVFFFTDAGKLSAFNATVAAPVGSGSQYTVQVTPTGAGDILLRVNGNTVLDRTFVNTNVPSNLETITYDTAGPTISSITRANPTDELTNADALTWRVTFNETVGAIAPSDFAVSGTTATVQSVTAPSGNAQLATGNSTPVFHDVQVSGGDLASLANGTVTLGLAPGQAIADIYGNVLTNTVPTGVNQNSYTIRNPDPTLLTASVYQRVANGYVGGPTLPLLGAIYASPTEDAEGCRIVMPEGLPATASYTLLDGSLQPVGDADALFSLTGGTTTSFRVTLTPTTPTGMNGVDFFPQFTCFNATADTITGFNSVRLNVGAAAGTNAISVPFTVSGDGVFRIATSGGFGFMSTIAASIGTSDGTGTPEQVTMTVSVDTGAASLPLSSLSLCQTNPATGACISPIGSSVTSVWQNGITQSFGVFAYDNGATGIPLDAANARVFIRYTDSNGVLRSIDSLPITSPAPAAADEPSPAHIIAAGRYAVSLRMPEGEWPNLQERTLFVQPDSLAIVDDGIRPVLVDLTSSDTLTGLQFTPANVRFDVADGRQAGEFWGVRDARSMTSLTWRDLAGEYGHGVFVTEAGEIRGSIGGCAVHGAGRGSAAEPIALALSGCEASGRYTGVLDLPANDSAPAALLIAGPTNGWRLER